jgi:GntR family transcriptional regulator
MAADQPATQQLTDQPNATPLYRQVREIVLQRIARGDWQPGTLLPAEPKLGQELGVSPGTVRKALDELAALNLVVRQQGRGTFVAAQTPDSSLFHFFRLIDPQGGRVTPSSRELEREQGAATPDERRRLALPARARVVRVRRLRQAGDGAIIERIVVPGALFPGLYGHPGELPNTLYDLYQRRYGRTVRRASESLCARAVDDAGDARLLQLKRGAAVLEIDRIAYSFDDLPIEWRRSLVDTRRLRYLSDLV